MIDRHGSIFHGQPGSISLDVCYLRFYTIPVAKREIYCGNNRIRSVCWKESAASIFCVGFGTLKPPRIEDMLCVLTNSASGHPKYFSLFTSAPLDIPSFKARSPLFKP
jgi:hypothetical protein